MKLQSEKVKISIVYISGPHKSQADRIFTSRANDDGYVIFDQVLRLGSMISLARYSHDSARLSQETLQILEDEVPATVTSSHTTSVRMLSQSSQFRTCFLMKSDSFSTVVQPTKGHSAACPHTPILWVTVRRRGSWSGERRQGA